MTRQAARWTLSSVAVILVLSACGSEEPDPNNLFPGEFWETSREYPLVRYANGLVTINDRCPVRRDTLNPKMPPIFVNGETVGFC